jgi:hypothetical protein
MKNFVVFTALYLTLSLLSCEDSSNELKSPPSDNLIYKNVGQEIPFETGMRWIEIYKQQEDKNSREIGSPNSLLGLGLGLGLPNSLTDDNLEDLMECIPNIVGFAFHYATDGYGVTHVLVIPIDESLSVWEEEPGRIIIDARTNAPISQTTAQAWAQTYKNAHPTGVWFHYFGINIFNEISEIPFFSDMDIQPALNDLLAPQMLLLVWINPLNLLGRTKDTACRVYDASNPCPPCGVN